ITIGAGRGSRRMIFFSVAGPTRGPGESGTFGAWLSTCLRLSSATAVWISRSITRSRTERVAGSTATRRGGSIVTNDLAGRVFCAGPVRVALVETLTLSLRGFGAAVVTSIGGDAGGVLAADAMLDSSRASSLARSLVD